MTRVLNIISDTNFGGAGRVILNYLHYANRKAFETVAIVPKNSLLTPMLKEQKVKVYEADGIADQSYSREGVRTLRALIRQLQPDIVHTHGALSGRIAAKLCGVPVVYTRHSVFPVPKKLHYPPGRWVNGLMNQLFADKIIAVSPAAKVNLTDAGVSPKKITVVMNGTAPAPVSTPLEKAALRAELGLRQDTFLFGILARLEDYKGHTYILHAARYLKKKGYQNFHILIAGTGPMEKELSRQIVEQDLRDVVTMLGFRSDAAAILNILDVQLNASYGTEATSMALLEGMSLGLPTIASSYGGNPFVVENGVTGLIFPCEDSQALTSCMEQLMTDKALCKSMGSQAKALFQKRFTGEVFARSIEDVYRSILKGAKK